MYGNQEILLYSRRRIKIIEYFTFRYVCYIYIFIPARRVRVYENIERTTIYYYYYYFNIDTVFAAKIHYNYFVYVGTIRESRLDDMVDSVY